MKSFYTLKTNINSIIDAINENRWLKFSGFIIGFIPFIKPFFHLLSKLLPSNKFMFSISWPNELVIIATCIIVLYCIIIIAIKNSQISTLKTISGTISSPSKIAFLTIHWDKDGNAYCPHCDILLTITRGHPKFTTASLFYYCVSCKEHFALFDENAQFVYPANAKKLFLQSLTPSE